ncbi:MAG: copper(I)-binding protein [bacterium]|jgi:copper(I)-binding protein
MKKSLLLIIGLILISSTVQAKILVQHAWVRAVPPVAKNSAIYLKIKNTGRKDVLLSAYTPVAKYTEMHNVLRINGMMHMKRVRQVSIPSHGVRLFKRGSYHIMLIQLKRKLRVGQIVPLTLRFKNAGTIRLRVKIKTGQMMKKMMHH